jgi:CheY-like chemotaxis protein
VAKILVADDNSNIQKMVGLALKDQGIDVVAVGNGEAAVRKISDVRPDLVLADVFMPVRNGYEVCNYVKQDSALSHIPVILLVGAFDPLDEQEAQRVGADGVLKKPFVPPDPLISMVKSALARAGVVIGAEPPPPPPPVVTMKAEPPPLPRVAPPPPPPPRPMAIPEPEIDLNAPVYSSRPAAISIDKADQPLAFGSLLGSPAQEEEAVFTTSSGAPVATPERDWGNATEQAEEEIEEDESKGAAWRVSSMDELPNEVPAGQTDWREAAFAGIGGEKAYKEWAPSVEKNSLTISEEEAAELAKAQPSQIVEEVARGPEDWSKAINTIFDAPKAVTEPIAPVALTPVAPIEVAPPPVPAFEAASAPPIYEPSYSAPVAETKPEAAASEPSPVLNSWMAGALSPWEAELQRARELSSTWDSTKIAPAAVAEETSVTEAFLDSGLMATAHEHVVEAIEEAKAEQPMETAPEVESSAPIESLYSPAAPEVEETQHVASHEPESAASEAVAEPTHVPAANGTAPVATEMDELVARVLAKMSPEVLQAVTREILKPVVEALVKDELGKK